MNAQQERNLFMDSLIKSNTPERLARKYNTTVSTVKKIIAKLENKSDSSDSASINEVHHTRAKYLKVSIPKDQEDVPESDIRLECSNHKKPHVFTRKRSEFFKKYGGCRKCDPFKHRRKNSKPLVAEQGIPEHPVNISNYMIQGL